MLCHLYNLALIGFGNVGRTFVSLLQRKRERLLQEHCVEFRVTGIATRTFGWRVDESGFDRSTTIERDLPSARTVDSLRHWMVGCRPDVVFETTSLDPQSGQPAI